MTKEWRNIFRCHARNTYDPDSKCLDIHKNNILKKKQKTKQKKRHNNNWLALIYTG